MIDAYGRKIRYLRISVTDLCNYRCKYCMREEGVDKHAHSDILSFEEIEEITAAAARLGIDKIRLTGGEPLVRKNVVSLCAEIKKIPGIKELTLTTNGSMLEQYASGLKAAGVDRLNVSLDTLDPQKFQTITRTGNLDSVMRGLDAARNAGYSRIKLNVVLIRGFNDDEIPAFVELTRENDYTVRFIELMPIGIASSWDTGSFLSSETVLQAAPDLVIEGTDGVSVRYRVPGYAGTIGLISPMSGKFCLTCNRIRLTADGKLKPCLHSAKEVPLKGLHGKELETALRDAIWNKPKEHHMDCLHASESARQMYEIGG